MRGHKNALTDLTCEHLKSILDYDPQTGIFRWKKRVGNHVVIGSVAGRAREKGRIIIGIHNKEYKAHRLAWLYMTGEWPKCEIDHKDENQSNNRFKNLRDVTPSQNHRNRGPQKNNTSGYKGVTYVVKRRKWIAGVKLNGYRHNLGAFDSAEAAYAAYCKAARKLHGKFAKL